VPPRLDPINVTGKLPVRGGAGGRSGRSPAGSSILVSVRGGEIGLIEVRTDKTASSARAKALRERTPPWSISRTRRKPCRYRITEEFWQPGVGRRPHDQPFTVRVVVVRQLLACAESCGRPPRIQDHALLDVGCSSWARQDMIDEAARRFARPPAGVV